MIANQNRQAGHGGPPPVLIQNQSPTMTQATTGKNELNFEFLKIKIILQSHPIPSHHLTVKWLVKHQGKMIMIL